LAGISDVKNTLQNCKKIIKFNKNTWETGINFSMKKNTLKNLYLLVFLTFLCSCAVQPHVKFETPGMEAEFKESAPYLYRFKISPDGRYVLSIGSTGYFSLYDINDGNQTLTGRFPPRIVLNSRRGGGGGFSPDGKYFAIGGEKTISLWDLQKREEVGSFDIEAVADISFSPDSKYLLAVAPGKMTLFTEPPGIMSLFNIQTGRKIKNFATKSYDEFSKVFFSKDGKYAYTTTRASLILWNVSTGTQIKRVSILPSIPLIFYIATAEISPDSKYIISANTKGHIVIWDAKSLETIKKVETEQTIWSVDISPDGKYLLSAGSEKIVIRDFNTLKEIKTIEHPSFGAFMNQIFAKFSPDGKQIISTALDSIKVWDFDSGKELASFITFENGEWIVLTPAGYYNSSEKGDQYYSVKVQGKAYTIEQLREAFYRPDLVKLALSGKSLEGYKTLADAGTPPVVEIVDTPAKTEKDEIKVTVKLTDTGSGIGDIRLYLNDTAVLVDSARGIKITPKAGEKSIFKTYTVKLLNGENIIKAVAFNGDNTMQSNPALHKLIASISIKKPSMYAVLIGINEYKNPKLTLKYAVADAKLFAETISHVSKPLFEKVEVKLLTTKEETTKEYIKKSLEDYKKLNPEDVFVFYVASHGTVDEGEYFLVTSNVGSLSTFRLKEDALTQAELKELIANVPSTKKFIVIDTCNAGKLGETLQMAMLTRGMSEETAVKILSKAVGSTIISASTSLQEALEGYKGHGLFTYALVEGLKGKADTDRDGFIKTLELASYVDSEVPALAEKIFKKAQYPTATPTGQSFPVGKVR